MTQWRIRPDRHDEFHVERLARTNGLSVSATLLRLLRSSLAQQGVERTIAAINDLNEAEGSRCVPCWLRPGQLADLDRICAAEGMKRGKAVRMLVIEAMRARGAHPQPKTS
jgi:hypothetical protein